MSKNTNTHKPSVTLWVGISTTEWSKQSALVKELVNRALTKGELGIIKLNQSGVGIKVLEFDSTILLPPSQYATLCGPEAAWIQGFIKKYQLRQDTAIGYFLTPEVVTSASKGLSK